MKKLLIGLLILISLISMSLIGVYIAARVSLGVDLFNTVGQLKTLSEKVNEEKIFNKSYDLNDLEKLKEQTNASIGDVIVFESGSGLDGYSIDYTAFSGSKTSPLFYTEENTGALIGIMFKQINNGKLVVGKKELDAKVLQVKFDNVNNETGECDFGISIKIDLKPYKNEMDSFPFSLIRSHFPNYLYITSVVHIEKDAEGLGYNLTSKYLTINKLNAEDTKDFFHTLDVLLKIGKLDDFNLQIGNIFVNLLIGTEEEPGFIYTIQKANGSGSFGFLNMTIDEVETPLLVF